MCGDEMRMVEPEWLTEMLERLFPPKPPQPTIMFMEEMERMLKEYTS